MRNSRARPLTASRAWKGAGVVTLLIRITQDGGELHGGRALVLGEPGQHALVDLARALSVVRRVDRDLTLGVVE